METTHAFWRLCKASHSTTDRKRGPSSPPSETLRTQRAASRRQRRSRRTESRWGSPWASTGLAPSLSGTCRSASWQKSVKRLVTSSPPSKSCTPTCASSATSTTAAATAGAALALQKPPTPTWRSEATKQAISLRTSRQQDGRRARQLMREVNSPSRTRC